MARKNPKRNRSPVLEYRQIPLPELRRRIEASRAEGNFRVGIDLAKECHRREASADHAALLGRLYLERGRQLVNKRLYAEALMVLSNALSLGQGSEELLHLMFECGLQARQYVSALSMYTKLREPAQRQQAAALLVDEALVAGETFERLCEPEIRDGAQRIRRAFAAFERGDTIAVAEELKLIGLTHPASGWKWLLRGLMAHSRDDANRARVSWGQVRGATRAARLAELLCTVLTPESGSISTVSPQLRARVLGHLISPRAMLLRQIKDNFEADRADEVLNDCARLIAGVDPAEREAYALRLARAVCSLACQRSSTSRKFHDLFGPLPEDPDLVRTAALPLEHERPPEALDAWELFLKKLHKVPAIPPELQNRARALIWRRMGDVALEIGWVDSRDPSESFSFSRFIRSSSLNAVHCYQNSLKHDPTDVATHERLLGLYDERGRTKEAEKQAIEILRRWPTHVSSLLYLGTQCFHRNAFRKALGYFEQAREVEPFNHETLGLIQHCYLLSARRRMEEGKLALARKDYQEAEKHQGAGESPGALFCKWAALEWLAGDAPCAEALLAKALEASPERVAVLFQLAIELRRARVDLQVCERFEAQLDEELKAPPRPAAIFRMVELMIAIDETRVTYPDQKSHQKALSGYLGRVSKPDGFDENQTLSICVYLKLVKAWKELERWARWGIERWPGNYLFAPMLGHAQRGQGKRKLPAATRKLLGKAGRQAADAGNFKVAGEIKALEFGFSFGKRGGLPPFLDPFHGMGDMEAMMDMLDTLEDSYDLPDFAKRPSAAPPRKPRKRQPQQDEKGLFDDLF